jgi:hypothetical protein
MSIYNIIVKKGKNENKLGPNPIGAPPPAHMDIMKHLGIR